MCFIPQLVFYARTGHKMWKGPQKNPKNSAFIGVHLRPFNPCKKVPR